MFHIYSKIHEWFCTLKTMNGRSLWINGLFSRPNGLTRCIFFHSFHSWKNMQLVSPFGLSKRPFIHTDQPFIVFFVQSFIFFIMNVEKEQYYIYKVGQNSSSCQWLNSLSTEVREERFQILPLMPLHRKYAQKCKFFFY